MFHGTTHCEAQSARHSVQNLQALLVNVVPQEPFIAA